MKKYLTTSIFLVILLSASAQTTLGFKFGSNFDAIEYRDIGESGIELPGLTKYLGINFGMALDIALYDDILSFSPELVLQTDALIGEDNQGIRSDIQVPLMLSCYVWPYFGFELGPAFRYNVVNYIENNTVWDKVENGEEKLDIGIAGGWRWKVNDNFALLMRAYIGLRKTLEVETLGIGYKTYNRGLELGFIYAGGGRGY